MKLRCLSNKYASEMKLQAMQLHADEKWYGPQKIHSIGN